MHRNKTPGFAYAILTLTPLFLASNHVIGRAVHTQIPPVGLSFWRWVVAVVVLAPFALPRIRTQWPVYRRHWRALALLGFLMICSTTLVLVALNMTFAINVSLINAIQPTLTVLFAWMFRNQSLSRWQALGIVLGFCGVAIMLSRADWSTLASLRLQPGDFIALLAMCGFSGYALNLYRLPNELSGVEALFGITLAGTLMLVPVYLFESATYATVPITTTSVAAILALALLVSVFGNLMWNAGNRIIGPSRASIFINLIPVFGAILAITFLDEELFLYHIVGGALVVAGLFLAAASRGGSAGGRRNGVAPSGVSSTRSR